MLFEDSSRVDTMLLRAVAGQPAKGLVVELNAASKDALLDAMRRRTHERQHYRQHTDSPLALLLLRLRKIKRDAAREALTAVIETTGSLERLDTFLLRGRTQSAHGDWTLPTPAGFDHEADAALRVWSFATDLEGALLGDRAPRNHLEFVWDACLSAPVAHAFLEEDAHGFVPRLSLRTEGPGHYCHGDGASVRSLLEGQARFSELKLLLDTVGPEETRRRLGNDADRSMMHAPLLVAARLRLPLYNYITLVLLDISLQQMPDPELLAQSDVNSVSWEAVYPGRFFDIALEQLSEVTIPRSMTDEDAYEFVLQATAGLGDAAARAAMAEFARRLPAPEDVLPRRQSLTTGTGYDSAVYERVLPRTGSGLLLDAFAGDTIAAALRARSDTPALMCFDEAQIEARLQRRIASLCLPPFVVTPIGLESYPTVNGDHGEHLALFADCATDLCIDEMACSATVTSTAKLLQAASMRSGDQYGARAMVLMAYRMGPTLGFLAQHLIGEILVGDA
jgi:hypothetical protein